MTTAAPVRRAGTTTTVTCRCCGGTRPVPVEAAAFDCGLCGARWRWASCQRCAALRLVADEVESWQCSTCNRANRSWWRTATAPRDEALVVRQRQEALREGRPLAARRRRLPLAAATVAAVAALAVAALAGAEPSTEQATRATCAAMHRLRPSLFNGSVDAAALRRSLGELRAVSSAADDAVAAAVRDLAAAPQLGGPEFLRAVTAVDEACSARAGD